MCQPTAKIPHAQTHFKYSPSSSHTSSSPLAGLARLVLLLLSHLTYMHTCMQARASYTASIAAMLAGMPSRWRRSSAGSAPLLSLEAS